MLFLRSDFATKNERTNCQMKKKLLFYVITILTFVLSCGNKNQSVSSYPSDSVSVVEDKVSTTPSSIKNLDSLAIGNIHFNISKEQFHKETETFFKENNYIDDIQIAELYGHFYKNRLSALFVISAPTYKGHTGNWKVLYEKEYERNMQTGFLEGSNPNIYYWADDCLDSGKPFTDIKSIVNHAYGRISYKYDSNNLDIYNYMDESKYKGGLGGGIDVEKMCEEVDKATSRMANDPAYQRKKKEHEDKYKNVPSWSVIIIYYAPLVEEEIKAIDKAKYEEEHEKSQEISNLINPNEHK